MIRRFKRDSPKPRPNLSPDGRRARDTFNAIAAGYDFFTFWFRRNFEEASDRLAGLFDLAGTSVLDVGTGTGVWAGLLAARGARVRGIDIAERQLARARRRHGNTITFRYGDAENLSEYRDGSFDFVTASFVLHGLRSGGRLSALREMRRVSRRAVVVHDYRGAFGWPTYLVELLERSDYRAFLRSFENELDTVFFKTRVIPVKCESALYLGW